jgi:hypothetical protein
MIRYGAQAEAIRPMPASEIFILRLKLLIIMTKAYLKGNPLGEFRKKAIGETANEVFYETLLQAEHLKQPDLEANTQAAPASQSGIDWDDHLFLQRVQLLAVMANAFSKDKVDGNFRKRAMADNVDFICEHFSERISLRDAKFLEVA